MEYLRLTYLPFRKIVLSSQLKSTLQPLFTNSYLMSEWAVEFEIWRKTDDQPLLEKLKNWVDQCTLKETAAQSSFENTFFAELWGYVHSGTQAKGLGFTLWPQYPIQKAGQGGGTGQADLSMGWFKHPKLPDTPQVLCEFKDIRSGLDAPQNRKGNTRSPVQQCADYLKYARDEHDPLGNEKLTPTWGIVSDMHEIRLYWRTRMHDQCQRFVISELLQSGKQAQQARFIFSRIFHSDWLLDKGNGAPLLKLLSGQRLREKSLEKTFYFEYRAYREHLFNSLLAANPAYQTKPRDLVKLTQKLLDRFLFILFCEDMGAHLHYPVNLLRELLIDTCKSNFFEADSSLLWSVHIKRLFECMRDGKAFSGHRINRFNGGLFAENDDIDKLVVPDGVFCQQGQSQNLSGHPLTLLYFSANYNFGIEEGGDRAIGLYTLGRIFEQSITDLEILEAEAANAPSLMKLGKRKTDGVYYTPEWVTAYIVEETLGLRIKELRGQLPPRPETEQVEADHTKTGKFKNKGCPSACYFKAFDTYEQKLGELKILDPACGSGAFLIQALKRLVSEYEWIATERSYVSYTFKQTVLFDMARTYREILAKNLYGVDVNAESVEITKLALWLHTAMPGKPLSTLDNHIVCGNSLVDHDIEQTIGPISDEQRKRINPFNYRSVFSQVFDTGGFDVIIGNPPYIKLQNMRQIQQEATEYWSAAKAADGTPKFHSAQTGNYDIYVLFIEQGVKLLTTQGRMGYIAPSVWAVNEYGEGLRGYLASTGNFDRWVDFNDFQIFDEAITYTALQFFSGKATDGIRAFFAPRGNEDISSLDWNEISPLPHSSLPQGTAWEFMPEADRLLIEKLRGRCKTLEQSSQNIMVGIQTSADSIYHLQRISPGKYRSFADKLNPIEVEIEDALMRPLVSGPEAKRYQSPRTDTWLLFPYDLSGEKPALRSAESMQLLFPKGWSYLCLHEKILRGRENGKMDRDSWFGYVYPKNLDKQECEKLIVAQTVPSMRVCFDHASEFYLNNVRVNGILPKGGNGWFLLGILNSPVADYVFRRTAKVKEGGFFEANKQFIAPIPIPDASPRQEQQVGQMATQIQGLHTAYRDKLIVMSQRIGASQLSTSPKSHDWLFGDTVKSDFIREHAKEKYPELKGAALTRWVNAEQELVLAGKLEALSCRLRPGVQLTIEQEKGCVRLKADGIPALEAFLLEKEGETNNWIAAQWRHVIRTTSITPSLTARKLLDALLNLKACSIDALRNQIIALDGELSELASQIAIKESEINALIYSLYELSPEDILHIETN
jgi:methylase of polypeptide subunit release factors